MRLYALCGRRAEALGQYERLREALITELGEEPSAWCRGLYQEIMAGRFPPEGSRREAESQEESAGRPADLHNLPVPRSSFVGRERELLEVKRALSTTRLLTLTGPGGSGKTRLALEVARELASVYPDGAWLVELASLSEPELVHQTVAGALGVREHPGHPLISTLTDALRPKRLLLVLDNCEHLIDACARFVDTMLASCPNLRILATSREALGVMGEANRRVPSLSLPEAGHPPLAGSLERYEAVELFVERACARLSGFELTIENARAVAEVCRKLDGIPLAIELATARMPALSVGQIAERLEDPLKLLTTGGRAVPPRHQTLRATLAWSYGLLGEPERGLFGRLSVFAGGFTLEAVSEGIEGDDALDLLGGLVDKSLVTTKTDPEGAVRYGMLEPVRQYGQEELEKSGEEEQARERHARYYLALAEQAEPELKGPRQTSWLERLAKERDNLRAAMAWLLKEGGAETAARLGWALWLFWAIRGPYAEGRRWMEEALAKGGTAMPASARAKALYVAGTMAPAQSDYRSAAALLEESIGLFRELGDKRGAAYALCSAGFVASSQGRYEEGVALLEEAADLSLEAGDRWCATYTHSWLALLWRNRGDHARAKRLAQRGLGFSREVGDKEGTSIALYILAGLARASGEHEQAKGLFEEAMTLSLEVGDEAKVAHCLQGLAAVAYAKEGEAARAARLWGAAEALMEKGEGDAYAYVYAPDLSLNQSQLAAARARLGEEAFAAVRTEGRAMTIERAVEYALSGGEPATPQAVARAPGGHTATAQPVALTRREREVALLIARGLTDRRAAEELYISERTVSTHVGKILKKLGLRSRAQISSALESDPG